MAAKTAKLASRPAAMASAIVEDPTLTRRYAFTNGQPPLSSGRNASSALIAETSEK